MNPLQEALLQLLYSITEVMMGHRRKTGAGGLEFIDPGTQKPREAWVLVTFDPEHVERVKALAAELQGDAILTPIPGFGSGAINEDDPA
jgi:hypothetical protein